MYAVKNLYNGNKLRADILSEEHFLYRWWFPEDSPVVAYLENYLAQHTEDIDMHYVYARLKRQELNNKTYYALYFGKSTNGRKRFGQHMRGSVKQSTLRETLCAIQELNGNPCAEEEINNILNECYYEWMEFMPEDHELIDSFEMMAIAIGYYPLNLEGNSSISKPWKTAIMDKRKKNKRL